MSAESSPSARRRWWKKLLLSPLFWGLICASIALPGFLSGNGMSLFPFLLNLVGGVFCSIAFIQFTYGFRRAWVGALIHTLVAVISGLALYYLVSRGGEFIRTLPEQKAALVLFFQMGAIPAVALIFLALLSRLTLVAKNPAKATTVTRLVPAWEEAGGRTQVEFSAVPMTMRSLTLAIVGICLLGGGLVFLLMILFDSFLLRFSSARLFIILFGVLIALPCYAGFKFVIGRKTSLWTMSFSTNRLIVQTEAKAVTIAYADLERMLWRSDSDYARVEIQSGEHDLSLLVGMAKMPKRVSPQLPPLSQKTVNWIEEAGLEKKLTRNPSVSIFVASAEERNELSTNRDYA